MNTSIPNWARQPLDKAGEHVLDRIERGFPVRLIATFDLKTCGYDEPIAELLANEELANFDYVPVRRNGTIIGLIEREHLSAPPPDSPIESAMRPLDESILIPAEESMLKFIENADLSPCRLVLDGTSISGIVTIADLQQLAVRPILFLLFTHVELLMAQVIRSSHLADGDWICLLSEPRQRAVLDKWESLKAANLAIDQLSATDFCDKREVLCKGDMLRVSKTKARDELGRIESLRNSVAHAGDYALDRMTAAQTIGAVKLCRLWIDRLRGMLSSGPDVLAHV